MHQRNQIERKAEHKLTGAILEMRQEFDLTEAEFCRIVTKILTDELLCVFKYQLRMERHGDTSVPADQAPREEQ